jgi:hypothetical protein
MIYSVVPRELEPQLLEQLTAHYAGQPDVKVIVDRRTGERRTRPGDTPQDGVAHQRELRDRRRRRAGGDFAPLRGEGSLTSAA